MKQTMQSDFELMSALRNCRLLTCVNARVGAEGKVGGCRFGTHGDVILSPDLWTNLRGGSKETGSLNKHRHFTRKENLEARVLNDRQKSARVPPPPPSLPLFSIPRHPNSFKQSVSRAVSRIVPVWLKHFLRGFATLFFKRSDILPQPPPLSTGKLKMPQSPRATRFIYLHTY